MSHTPKHIPMLFNSKTDDLEKSFHECGAGPLLCEHSWQPKYRLSLKVGKKVFIPSANLRENPLPVRLLDATVH